MASGTGTFEKFSESARDVYSDYLMSLAHQSEETRLSIEQALEHFSKEVQGINESINARLVTLHERYVESLTAAWTQNKPECEQAYETYTAALGELLRPPSSDELARHENATSLFQDRLRDAAKPDSVQASYADALTAYLTDSAKVWHREAAVKRVVETAEAYFKYLHEYVMNAQTGTAAAHREYIASLQSLSNEENVTESFESACQSCFDSACTAWSAFQENQASAVETASAGIEGAAAACGYRGHPGQ